MLTLAPFYACNRALILIFSIDFPGTGPPRGGPFTPVANFWRSGRSPGLGLESPGRKSAAKQVDLEPERFCGSSGAGRLPLNLSCFYGLSSGSFVNGLAFVPGIPQPESPLARNRRILLLPLPPFYARSNSVFTSAFHPVHAEAAARPRDRCNADIGHPLTSVRANLGCDGRSPPYRCCFTNRSVRRK